MKTQDHSFETPRSGRTDRALQGSFIQAMPKLELHVHLEGAIRPETTLELFQRRRHPEFTTLEDVQRLFVHKDFLDFLEHYVAISRLLTDADSIELITRQFIEDLAAQNVHYAEVIISPGALALRGLHPDAMLEGIKRGCRAARRQHDVEIALVVDLVRNMGVENGWEMARLAARWRDRGVAGITLGGNERDFPAAPFADIYRWAADQGLRTTAHAGEWAGPASIWDCLRLLRVERIGHGVRMAEDPDLLAHAVERRVPIECCPGSNVATGVAPSWAAHPVRRLFDAGVFLSVSTDDPPLFGTTLVQELERLQTVHGFSEREMIQLQAHAIEMSFLPEDRKAACQQELDAFAVSWQDG